LRAKQEYGRMVEGARTLAKEHDLYFMTITCRGREMSLKESEKNYGYWTNRFLDACRSRAKSKAHHSACHYASVTERQKRGHPHTHFITTFSPCDLFNGFTTSWTTDHMRGKGLVRREALRSNWLSSAVQRSGLGREYAFSKIKTVEGASRYAAKYMFKDTALREKWPPGWKRVRYSNNWPKLERKKTDAFVLLSREDWQHLARVAMIVTPDTEETEWYLHAVLRGSDVMIRSAREKVKQT